MSEKQKQIFILSGQSNMSGRGGVITDTNNHNHKHWNGVVPPECRPHPNILRFTATHHWEVARDPLHSDIDSKKTCGVGPGMPFANAIRERVGGTLGLVPCAVGGTKIREWARGEELYENMVKRAKCAVMDGGDLMGLLWFQGESDTLTAQDADAYKDRMVKFVDDVRGDLHLPCLPIIQLRMKPQAYTSATESDQEPFSPFSVLLSNNSVNRFMKGLNRYEGGPKKTKNRIGSNQSNNLDLISNRIELYTHP